jgi:hypothetical protein
MCMFSSTFSCFSPHQIAVWALFTTYEMNNSVAKGKAINSSKWHDDSSCWHKLYAVDAVLLGAPGAVTLVWFSASVWERKSICFLTLTYLLTPSSTAILEKLTGLQLVKKFPTFYGTRRFITAFTSARELSLSTESSFQSILLHPTSWIFILILSSHLRLDLPSYLSFRFPHKHPVYASPLLLIYKMFNLLLSA